MAKSLAVGSVEEYVIGDERDYGRSLFARDIARARDMTDAGIGLSLIFVGVVGQIFDATHREELDFGLWWYVVLLGVFILAAAAWRG